MNEAALLSVDLIHEAMSENRQIRFLYCEWNVKKELVPRRNGMIYEISPWALTWDDENYYLVGYEASTDRIKHYRVDKMQNMEISKKERAGQENFQNFDLAAFSRKTFGMFGGPDADVVLRCANSLAGVIIDRFGTETMLVPEDEEHFHVHVTIAVSPQFYGWVTGVGSGIEISSPEEVRAGYKKYLQGILSKY